MYKTLGTMILITLFASGCTVAPKVMEKKVITNPTTQQGYPIDRCYTWAHNCDKPVADKICRDNGYQYSVKSTWEHKSPTQLLTGKICNASYCGAITYIECVREKR